VDAVVSLEEARAMIDQAKEFLREAERIAATSE